MPLRQLKLPGHNARHKINLQFRKLVRSACEDAIPLFPSTTEIAIEETAKP
jgi:hypothetical protein